MNTIKPLSIGKTRRLILSDNVLWSGKVVYERNDFDASGNTSINEICLRIRGWRC